LNEKVLNDPTVEVVVKTRSDKPSTELPARMYSSLKYEFRQFVRGSCINKTTLLMSKIQVINPETNKEVKKNSSSILKGVVDGALTVDASGKQLTSKTKLQFTDVSYHHGKSQFSLQICYYIPSELNVPVLVIRSAPFQIFARRSLPLKTIGKTKKGIQKKKKVSLEDYLKGLDELITFKNKLKEHERRMAIENALKKLVYSGQESQTFEPICSQHQQFTQMMNTPMFSNNEVNLDNLFADFGNIDTPDNLTDIGVDLDNALLA